VPCIRELVAELELELLVAKVLNQFTQTLKPVV
jgi:hypothetical protein